MIIHNLETQNSILNQFVAEIRSETIQKDSMRFRRNIERIGEILGYELSKTLHYIDEVIQTPLGVKNTQLPINDIVLCSVLRAGLPLHQGLLNYFDAAESAFISAYRAHQNDDNDFTIISKYLACPSIENKTVLLADPMLATGKTLENTFEVIRKNGTPKDLHIVSVIGSKEGVAYIEKIFPENTHLWIATIDSELNDKAYIVPGLGDAGDLSFGMKL